MNKTSVFGKAKGASYYQDGLAFDSEGKTQEAIEAYRMAVALDPEMAEAHYNLGVNLAFQGNFDEAIRCWRRAVWLNGNFTQDLITAFDLDHELKESDLIPIFSFPKKFSLSKP
ncbi:tetratricopeptide repeat protein [bacterium]|nr:tetratricopeptide repeat protein [bacterium]